MNIKTQRQDKSYAIKIIAEDSGQEIGRAYLYVIFNDLHEEPYGLMEDVYVEEEHRGKGIGKELVLALIKEAKKQGCYKLIGQSRHGKDGLHDFYGRVGFKDHGKNFRMDF